MTGRVLGRWGQGEELAQVLEGALTPKLGAGTCVEEALSSQQRPLSLGPGCRQGERSEAVSCDTFTFLVA